MSESDSFVRDVLVLQDAARAAMLPGEKQEQVVLQVEKGLRAELQGNRLHALVGGEGEAGDAPEGGDVLVLLSDGFFQPARSPRGRRAGQAPRDAGTAARSAYSAFSSAVVKLPGGAQARSPRGCPPAW